MQVSANAGAAKQATAKAAHIRASILSLVVVGLCCWAEFAFPPWQCVFAQSYGLQQKRSVTLPPLPPSAGTNSNICSSVPPSRGLFGHATTHGTFVAGNLIASAKMEFVRENARMTGSLFNHLVGAGEQRL
jgi:hypothetical protein